MNKIKIIFILIIFSFTLFSENIRIDKDKKFLQFIINNYQKIYEDAQDLYDYAIKGARGIYTSIERDNMLKEIHNKIEKLNNSIENIKYNNKPVFKTENTYISNQKIKYAIRDPRFINNKNVFFLIKNINKSDPYSMNEIKVLLDCFFANLDGTIVMEKFFLKKNKSLSSN